MATTTGTGITTTADPLELPTAFGPPPVRGRLRAAPEDFQVEERLGFEPDGRDGHVLLTVEKRGANTAWVAARLAAAAGVAVRDVGFSGQKDRNAVTRQAYTLPWRTQAPFEECLGFAGDGFRVLTAARHGRKLRPGSHRANRFLLRVRDVQGDRVALAQRLELLLAHGVPDYFGPQRFGRDGSNLARARAWIASGAAPRERSLRSFALSAARSALFNAVLAERVRRGNWNELLPGEAVMLDGRRSFFRAPEIDAVLAARCAAQDVHPSGPLWGRGESPATGAALELESRVLSTEPGFVQLLETAGLEHERRALRLRPAGLRWTLEDDVLTLEFELPRGAFATAVLHEIVADAWQAADSPGD